MERRGDDAAVAAAGMEASERPGQRAMESASVSQGARPPTRARARGGGGGGGGVVVVVVVVVVVGRPAGRARRERGACARKYAPRSVRSAGESMCGMLTALKLTVERTWGMTSKNRGMVLESGCR